MLSLEWSRVDLSDDRAVISLPASKSKNKRPRMLVVEDELLALLQRRATDRAASTLVFHRDGRPIRDFRATWEHACTTAKVEGLLFHDLRRSAVRNMVRARVPEKVAMQVSGHETRSIFDRYNVVSDDDIAAATRAVSRYVAREQGKGPRPVPLHPDAHTSRTVEADRPTGTTGDTV